MKSKILKYIFLIIFFFSTLILNCDKLLPENNYIFNNKILQSNCDTVYYIIGEFRVDKIIKLQNDMYLIYLTNSTRDKIYTVISKKYNDEQLNQFFENCEQIRENEIYIFRLDFLIPHCKDEVVIGDKYLSGTYVINDEEIFLPQEIIKGDLFVSLNLDGLLYMNLIFTDEIQKF
ncbi:MAG TPA: hypothetical protein PLA78_07595 [Bacteroidales bacterium]|jgi:hypothetical protein|nr:hypothetical protein [Bacteroidales bacterium]HPX45022.1 hypothetical protein [Bacteroidales bacterium]HQM79008.1 hypothetical protein [Bacteroidales bacterium]